MYFFQILGCSLEVDVLEGERDIHNFWNNNSNNNNNTNNIIILPVELRHVP